VDTTTERRNGNWKRKAFIALKKFHISNSISEKIYIIYSKVNNFIKYRDPYFFRSVAIEISTDCNRTCNYCPNTLEGTPTEFMSEDTFKKVIKELQSIKFSGVINYHFYNEPLLDKRLPEFVRYVNKHLPSCVSRVFSNGDFLTLDLADELIDAGVSDLNITIHDFKAEDLLKKLGPVLEKYPGYISVTSLHGKPLLNRGGAIDVDLLDKKDNCIDPLVILQVDYKGNVLLCCNDYYREHSFGNITNKNISQIWQGDEFVKLRRELREGIAELEICRACMGKE
jgi:radical SAM protein with 4Fe4S-binding SPASM domain